jgi:hypothetical protein
MTGQGYIRTWARTSSPNIEPNASNHDLSVNLNFKSRGYNCKRVSGMLMLGAARKIVFVKEFILNSRP